MKSAKFNISEFEEFEKRLQSGMVDGALIRFTKSRMYKQKGKKFSKQNICFVDEKVINDILPNANCVKVFFGNNKIALQLGIDFQDKNSYALRKYTSHIYNITCVGFNDYETKKFFEDDIMVDFDNKVIMLGIEKDGNEKN